MDRGKSSSVPKVSIKVVQDHAAKLSVISQGSGSFLVVGCMGLGGRFGGDFWFRVMAKASNLVVQTGSKFRLLSGYRQRAQVVGLFAESLE